MNIQGGMEGIAFKNGYSIVKIRGMAIVGMSLGNSYFRREAIDNLLAYCGGIFSHTKIMIPDIPAKHTYEAIGYSSVKAERKARLNGNTLRNHCKKSIDTIILRNVKSDVKLVDWENQINSHKAYQRELRKIMEIYQHQLLFRQEARETTSAVLEGKLKSRMKIDEAVNKGVYYLLKELAFLSASPKIFETKRVTYVYHDHWKIYEDFIEGKFDKKQRKDLGFIIIR